MPKRVTTKTRIRYRTHRKDRPAPRFSTVKKNLYHRVVTHSDVRHRMQHKFRKFG